MDALPVILVAALAAGIVGIALGRRGRRADDHRVCRRCRRDLHGTDSPRCPECGHALRDDWLDVRVGNREPMRWLTALGLLLATPAVILIAVLITAAAAGDRLDPHKPAWLLAFELRLAGDDRGPRVFDELAARHADGTLSAEHREAAVRWVLDRQGDAATAWNDKYGDFAVDAFEDGLLGDIDVRRYVVQGVGPALRVRDPIRPGAPVLLGVTGPSRMHARHNRVRFRRLPSLYEARVESADGRTLGRVNLLLDNIGVVTVPIRPDPPLADGERVEVVVDWQPASPASVGPPLADPPANRLPVRVDGRESVELVASPEIDAAVRAILTIERMPVRVHRLTPDGEAQTHFGLSAMPHFDHPAGLPVAVGGRVALRLPDGTELDAGSPVTLPAGAGGAMSYQTSSTADLPVPLPARVDVILRPDPAAADFTLDVRRMWGGTLTFEGVPVRVTPGAEGATRPAGEGGE